MRSSASLKDKEVAPHLAVIAVQVMFGTWPIFGKIVLRTISSTGLVGVRILGATFVFALLHRKAREIFNSDESFIALLGQFDIHECKIMEDFCLAYKDRRVGEDLHPLIKGSGAFRRFKDGVYSMGAEKAWHQFRRMEFERIAIEWLEEEGIPYTRDDATQVSHQTM